MKFSAVVAFFAFGTAMVAALPQAAGDAAAPAAPQSQCSQGQAQCCGTVKDGDAARQASDLLGLGDIAGAIGLGCQKIPINVIGAAVNADNQCKSTPVCCTGDEHNGLVQVGCTPLPIN